MKMKSRVVVARRMGDGGVWRRDESSNEGWV